MEFIEQTDDRGDFLAVICRGGSFTIDASDRDILADGEWWVFAPRSVHCEYVVRSKPGGLVLMHRQLLPPPTGLEVDHEDGIGTNNRRYNLRIASRSQNVWHHHHYKKSATGLIGSYPVGKAGRFAAIIKDAGKPRYLGTFDTAEDAAMCRDKEAYRLRGKYARLNYPDRFTS